MRLKHLVLGLLTSLLLSSPAIAGNVTFMDGNALSGAGRADIAAAAQRWSFDSVVFINTDAPSKSAFAARVISIGSGNVLAIGIDPKHRFTHVAYGDATRIPRSEVDTIWKQGNSSFKVGDLAGGIRAIGDYANGTIPQLVAQRNEKAERYLSPGGDVIPTPQEVLKQQRLDADAALARARAEQARAERETRVAQERAKAAKSAEDSASGWAIFGFVLIGAVLAFVLYKARQERRAQRGASVRTGYPPSYPQIEASYPQRKDNDDLFSSTRSAPAPRIIPSGRMSTLSAPMIVSQAPPPRSDIDPLLAGVVGYELGKSAGASEERHHDHDRYRSPAPRNPTPAPVESSSGGGGWGADPAPARGGGGWDAPARSPTPVPTYRSPPPPQPPPLSDEGGSYEGVGGGDSGGSSGGGDW